MWLTVGITYAYIQRVRHSTSCTVKELSISALDLFHFEQTEPVSHTGTIHRTGICGQSLFVYSIQQPGRIERGQPLSVPVLSRPQGCTTRAHAPPGHIAAPRGHRPPGAASGQPTPRTPRNDTDTLGGRTFYYNHHGEARHVAGHSESRSSPRRGPRSRLPAGITANGRP